MNRNVSLSSHNGNHSSARLRFSATVLLLLVCNYPGQSLAQTNAQRSQAATTTANSNAFCTALPKFYWEIGDRNLKLASGTHGIAPPTATTQMAVYSASKWIYGAYVYQKRGGQLNSADIQALRMQAGYTENSQCLFNTTVGTCHTAMDVQDPGAIGKYYYGPGHFQKHASVDLALASKNKTQLATEIHAQLGSDFVFTYNVPQLAGQGKSSAADYAIFLRKLLNGNLLLGAVLGSSPVCTYTGPTNATTLRTNCPTSLYSPVSDPAAGSDRDWDYSLGHWVETDPNPADPDDGAFSSAGAAGFYPWIDASKTYYGVLARLQVGATSAADSVNCGRKIRKAWLTATPQ